MEQYMENLYGLSVTFNGTSILDKHVKCLVKCLYKDPQYENLALFIDQKPSFLNSVSANRVHRQSGFKITDCVFQCGYQIYGKTRYPVCISDLRTEIPRSVYKSQTGKIGLLFSNHADYHNNRRRESDLVMSYSGTITDPYSL